MQVEVSVSGKTSVSVAGPQAVTAITPAVNSTAIIASNPFQKLHVAATDKAGVSFGAPDAVTALTAVKNTQKVLVSGVVGGTNVAGINGLSGDTSPALGGDLDVNGFSFTSKDSDDIIFTPIGTGSIRLDGVVEFKRFSTPPAAFAGGMYADDNNNLYFGIEES